MEELNQIPEKIQILIAAFLAGFINKEDIELLNEWISESEDHLQMFNAYKSAWLLSGKQVRTGTAKVEDELRKVKAKFRSDKPVFNFWRISRIAGLWIIIFITGALSTYFVNRGLINNEYQQNTTISAPLGSKSRVNLPDGTLVWLNAGSNITYNSNFGKSTRELILTGEAYFDVAKNEKLPFFVKTKKNITIKVLGTAFNVKAYPEESYVETTVERGKVQVSTLYSKSKQNNTVTLLPKQKIKIKCGADAIALNSIQKKSGSHSADNELNIDEKEIALEKNVETKIYTSWKEGVWIIESETLESIAIKIERNYNVSIDFEDIELKEYIFSGVLKDETLEQLLELIKLSAPINYDIKQHRVILTKNRLIDSTN